MADYDLGTAHGKIRVDYEDKGFKAADKDMSSLGEKAKGMAATLGKVKARWGKDFSEMSDNTAKFAGVFASMVGTVAFAVGTFSSAGQSLATLGGAMTGASEIAGSLGVAMGGVPEGTENFPDVIKKVIQMAAAIALFRGSMFLLAGLAMRFRGLRFASPLLRGLGSSVFALSAPLQFLSKMAMDVAFAIREWRLVKQISKFVLMGTAAFAGLGGVIWVVTGLADAIRQLSGLVGLLPGVVLAAGIAFGAAKIAFSGFMDAIKSGDLSKISKEAGESVTAIRGFKDEWNRLKMAVQDEFFKGMSEQLTRVGNIVLPIMQKGLVGVAGALRGAATEALGFFEGAQAQRDMNVAFGFTKTIIENLSKTVRPLLQVFMDLAIVGLGLFQDMTRGAGESAQGFADFVREARESGRLADWMRGGIQGLKDLWAIAKNVGSTMSTIFDGLGTGESAGFLSTLRSASESMRAFFESAKGQEVLATLSTFIQRAQENMRLIADVVLNYLLPAFNQFQPVLQAMSDGVVGGLVEGLQILAPIFFAIGAALGPIAPLLGFILKGMVQTVVVVMGLVVAFKILSAAFLILHSGLRALKFAFAIAGFALRLFTGQLRAGELAALRFMWALIKSIGRGIKAWIVGLVQGIWANIRWVASTIWAAVTTVAQWIWAKVVLIANWIAMRVAAAANAIASAVVWVAQAIWARAQLIMLWIMIKVQLIAQWIALKVQAALAAAQVGLAWLASTISSTAQIVAAWVVARAQLVAAWLTMKIQAAIAAIQTAATWVATQVAATATVVAAWIGARIAAIGAWISMAAQAVVSAAIMAYQWFVALGPVGWVIAIIIGLVALIIANWDTIVAATQAAWQWFMESVVNPVNEMAESVNATVNGFIDGLISDFNDFVAQSAANWEQFKADCQRVVDNVVGFFQRLPGQIMNFLNSLPGTLARLGTNMATSLLSGLASLGNRIMTFLMDKARQALNAVMSFFGIASPSKVFIWIGEMIGDGFVKGISMMKNRVADEARTMAEGVKTAVEGPVAAAMEVLAAMGDGIRVFEDFSFKGMSDNLGKYNDELVDMMRKSGFKDPKLFIESFVKGGGVGAQVIQPPKWNAYARATGGDGAVTPNNIIESVTIDAKSIKDMNNVVDFFEKVGQTARTGKANP